MFWGNAWNEKELPSHLNVPLVKRLFLALKNLI